MGVYGKDIVMYGIVKLWYDLCKELVLADFGKPGTVVVLYDLVMVVSLTVVTVVLPAMLVKYWTIVCKQLTIGRCGPLKKYRHR